VRSFLYILSYILGSVTLVVIVAAAIGAGVMVYKGRTLDAESKAFVDSAVPAITQTWSKEQLLEQATPELRDSIRPEALSALFEHLSQLGRLVAYEGAKGDAAMS
jgi:hypothetical protein